MRQTSPGPSAWRDRALLSRAETAAIFNRSTSWVDNQITRLALDAVDRDNGRRFVTTASAAQLLDCLAAKRARSLVEPNRIPPHLRLVVDNT